MEDIINKAIVFAANAHKGAVRKGSKLPYILHPLETGVIVSAMTNEKEVIAAAILHDVLEDTEVTYEELKREFGKAADYVCAESENKRRELPAEATWKIRKQETIERLQQETCLEIKMIALADKLSNIRSMYYDYNKLGDALWERFHEKRKEMQGWYYKSLVKALEDLNCYLAWQEYKMLVERVFGEE
ncbi:HD domain-containing protein [[Clostridium] polysaccharolyticum]|nr:HD domain-containing protein [[Clostridium] polysaccharolyticum]